MASPHWNCCRKSLSDLFCFFFFNFYFFLIFRNLFAFPFFFYFKNVFHTCLWKPKVKLLCFIKGIVMMPGEKEACWLLWSLASTFGVCLSFLTLRHSLNFLHLLCSECGNPLILSLFPHLNSKGDHVRTCMWVCCACRCGIRQILSM